MDETKPRPRRRAKPKVQEWTRGDMVEEGSDGP